ncbi:CelD/BcsL family acetyltransferase involved in cellulose biosynthesis [Bradyrhizobium sp. i1.8.4]|uniref:hypothetical protein n=1 Tax=unclassified Bradyrhizobium TaxID=2631580 RepID=UPI003D217CFF
MTVLTTAVEKFGARVASYAVGYRVELVSDWAQAVARWGAFEPLTAFQHPQWYASWYRAFASTDGVSPLIALVRDAATGERAALLPLICNRQGGLRIIEFADLNLTDFNAPLLGPAAPRDDVAHGSFGVICRPRCASRTAEPILFVFARCRSSSRRVPIRWRCSMASGRRSSMAIC